MSPIIPVEELTNDRHYWRCYSGLPRHRKMWRLPSNDARWAWVTLLCAASETGGYFESDEHVEAYIGAKNIKFLPIFRQVGLLDGLIVHDWEHYQELSDPVSATELGERAKAARERLESQGLRDNAEEQVKHRSLQEWHTYIVSGGNMAGKYGEFMGAMFGTMPKQADYGRIAKMLKDFPGGLLALMSATCDTALRGVKGDPISYLSGIQRRRSEPVKTSVRDAALEG